jgi:C4-dicarboxylate-specific signal transduction histidine kinase
MDTTWIVILVVIAVLILLALLILGRRQRERRLEGKREEAGQLRDQARVSERRAQEAELAAEEQAEVARRERAAAQQRAERARDVDPDVDDDNR